jgi:hypothetical protein
MDLKELAIRRNFDLRVLSSMRCDTFDFEAYRSTRDLNDRKRTVTDLEDTSVSKYRFTLRVRTHTGPHSFSDMTEIGIDTDVPDYPKREPRTWIISRAVPWSPHFMTGAPVCIGDEFWKPKKGHITLGHLAIHLCHLLNWDEKGRGGGYVGWNAEAIALHKRVYNNGPINPDLEYPALPTWLTGSGDTPNPSFLIIPATAQEPAFKVVTAPPADHGFRIMSP